MLAIDRLSSAMHVAASTCLRVQACALCDAGRTDGKLQLFETLTWRYEMASQGGSGHLIDALWSGAGALPSLVLVYSKQLVSLHFTEPAPSLHVQLMALDVPQVWDSVEVSSAGGKRSATDGVRLHRTRSTAACQRSSVPHSRLRFVCEELVELICMLSGGGGGSMGLAAQSTADSASRRSCVLGPRAAFRDYSGAFLERAVHRTCTAAAEHAHGRSR